MTLCLQIKVKIRKMTLRNIFGRFISWLRHADYNKVLPSSFGIVNLENFDIWKFRLNTIMKKMLVLLVEVKCSETTFFCIISMVWYSLMSSLISKHLRSQNCCQLPLQGTLITQKYSFLEMISTDRIFIFWVVLVVLILFVL